MRVRNIVVAALVSLMGIGVAFAEGEPLACQDVETGGLKWENGRWKVVRYNLEKFILVLDGGLLTSESVAKVFGVTGSSNGVNCNAFLVDYISCINFRGSDSLFFSTRTLNGGISQLSGGIDDSQDYRDSLFVRAFECQKF